MQLQQIFGFHAVTGRLKRHPQTIKEIYIDVSRKDPRVQSLVKLIKESNVRMITVSGDRLDGMSANGRHQGVIAKVETLELHHNLDDLLDDLVGVPLLLVLDGVQDPHNLGACLRVADGAGVHAVIAPKDRAASMNATVAKVASGAAETVPYITVTNLARTLRELKERDIWLIGTDGDAEKNVYDVSYTMPLAIIMGAEGTGMRRLTKESCDELIHIPMNGMVESLNVSVASGICLFEAVRQRTQT